MSWFAGGIAALALGCLLGSACSAPSPPGGAAPASRESPEQAWVVLTFDIDTDGSPKNIRVLQSSHGGEYDSAASRAIAKWRYKPTVVDGKAAWVRDQKIKLMFKRTDPAK
jgi:TonB family protein